MDNQALDIRHPIYIVSKGRHYNPLTAKLFLRHNIDFRIVIEPQERDRYREQIPDEKILVLPFSVFGMSG